MNAIKNYLDNMFRNLPNTEEVRRAKSELLEMMEDKYEELIKEGKTENEAVGIVISEFGNLDELAETLGITEAVTENPDEDKPMLSMDRVKDYLTMNSQRSILAPLGIGLCIFAPAFTILADMLHLNVGAIGVSLMFLAVAAAVILFIISANKKKEYSEVRKKQCSLSIECAEYVRSERRSFKSSYGLMSSFGIGLCILSIVNPMIIGSIPYIPDSFGAVLFFFFIALGVFLITSSHIKMEGYDRLLELNESGKMAEEFVPKSDRKVNKAPIIISAVAVVVIALVMCGIGIFNTIVDGVFTIRDNSESVATTYEIGEGDQMSDTVKSMKFELSACEVNIRTAEGTGLISVEYTGSDKLKPAITCDNGKFVATQKGSGFSFGIHSTTGPKLEIVIGKDVNLDSIEMDIDAGNIKFNGISADYVYGDIDAGNIEISNCDFRKVEFDVDAGNYGINDSTLNKVYISTDAGNIEINDTVMEDVEIDVNFGNVEIKGVDNLADYEVNCEVDAGSSRVGSTKGREIHQNGNGAGTITVSVDAGNIEVN